MFVSLGPIAAAPRILYTPLALPAQARIGEPTLLYVDGLVAPVHVYFSNGTTPSIEATPIQVDTARGFLLARVPAGAVTGYMKVSANGVDSPLYYFRILPASFTQGTDVLSGQLTTGGSPVANVTLLLLRDTGCSLPALQDFALTDATGHYTMHGVNGAYGVYTFPAVSSGLAGSASGAALNVAPTTLDISLTAGTLVTGRVVDAATPATGVAGARLEFNGPSFDHFVTNGTGNFSARVGAANWAIRVRPPPGDAHAFTKADFAIAGTSQNLGNLPLSGGVHVSGVVTRQVDGTPIAGAEITAFGPEFCCGKRDRKYTAGDGSYDLYVPPNETIETLVNFDDDVVFADVDGGNQAIGTTPVVLNLAAREAAFITGTATDLDTLAGIRDLELIGISGEHPSAVAFSCADGGYRLRVVPSAGGYRVRTWFSNSGPAYATKTWNDTPAGTYFPCEGTLVSASTAGSTTAGIDLRVPRAASVQGLISSQAGGCADDLGMQAVFVDDGSSHACGMGTLDDNVPPSGYRLTLLPPSSVVPGLRACAYVGTYNPQCYSLKTPPAYDAIVVGAGATASSINFCLTPCASPHNIYRDFDGDGHGNGSSPVLACAPPPGYTTTGDDCDDANAAVWATPGEARALLFTSHTTLGWTAPSALGGASVAYDLLRSGIPADFVAAATCVATDSAGTTAVDSVSPPSGAAFFYLVRAENACPAGQGILGRSSGGVPIAGRSCP